MKGIFRVQFWSVSFPIIYVFKNIENRLRRVILRLKICTNKCSSGNGLTLFLFFMF